MISVIIPTLNAEETLPETLAALIPAAVEGLVREVIVADGGSSDATARIADQAGVEYIQCPAGRGQQLAAAAARARFPWLLMLHADTVLAEGWVREAGAFVRSVEEGRRSASAAVFRFKLDDLGMKPRILEALVRLRCLVFRLPYGDQGLLVPRQLYLDAGGFKPIPIMEDVDLVRRIGRRRIVLLETAALTSAERYRRDGYVKRSLRNQLCLWLYFLGLPAGRIATLYPGRQRTGRAGAAER